MQHGRVAITSAPYQMSRPLLLWISGRNREGGDRWGSGWPEARTRNQNKAEPDAATTDLCQGVFAKGAPGCIEYLASLALTCSFVQEFGHTWREFLLLPLPRDVVKAVLQHMELVILPASLSPLMFAEFLTRCAGQGLREHT